MPLLYHPSLMDGDTFLCQQLSANEEGTTIPNKPCCWITKMMELLIESSFLFFVDVVACGRL